MLTQEQFEDRLHRMHGGNRYAAADVYEHLEANPPDPFDRDAVDKWANAYVYSAYAMNGPFTVKGDYEEVRDDLEFLYDLLVDKGYFESLEEVKSYANRLRLQNEIVVWGDGNGRNERIYADITVRAPKFAHVKHTSPIRYMAGITDRIATAVKEEPMQMIGGAALLAGAAFLLVTALGKKKKG